MEDCQSNSDEKDKKMLAVAKHIVNALGTCESRTDDVLKLLSQLLPTPKMAEVVRRKGEISKFKDMLNSSQELLLSWESNSSMIWDSGAEEAKKYLRTVNEVQQLTEDMESTSLNGDSEVNELLCRAHSVLQTAMTRLEEEFIHILDQNKQNFEPEHMSFHSCEDDFAGEDSTYSLDGYSVVNAQMNINGDNINGSEEFIIDLVNPNVIPDLKSIANAMLRSKYDQECWQAYSSIRKDALDDCLLILEVEKLSIEEIVRMDWTHLNAKIMKWIRAMKLFIRVYLASEKFLCDQIFVEFGALRWTCFIEASKSSILLLLNFCEAIAIGPRSPEKLYRTLDMYECLVDLLPDIDALFSEEAGSCVRTESHEVLRRLGGTVVKTFTEFENAVRQNTSTTPFAGGGVHHLTKYVMNYLKVLTVYSDTLTSLFTDIEDVDPSSPSISGSNATVQEDRRSRDPHNVTPMVQSLQSVISTLEENLDGKSKLYRDSSLQHFFLMNNIYYMVQKVKNSELQAFLGDDWIRWHNAKFQKHAVNYERASWSVILSFLKDEGLIHAGSSSISKSALKERFKNFNLTFEEIYKTQTAWLIPDPQLREDLRISISLKILQAYRTFLGRHSNQLEGKKYGGKFIKHSAEDLQDYLLDLFEGHPKSLHHPRRR